ncbi:DNA repair protein [Venustampulla echinocandica]|uniref:DNA repair protein REV1 n=1 Tax=Venustampulla echinocandica TaxID=2656787 RepID=A0A370TH54_9HELO|nr:DNA repair protein [Venustampulla echinocandica]RDL34534.1 DNA repair protein [Venustampulla echinocandica]
MGSRLEKNSASVRKRIEAHTFEDEEGDEYEGSKFGGFDDYFRRKKIKLQNLDAEIRSSSLGNPKIFRGVVAHVNGYTQPSLNDLHHLIVTHGGVFMQYLDGKTTVTHIIASNLTPRKAIEFRRYRIVKPAWIVDSVEAGKLLPWDAYRVLDEGSGQRQLAFESGKIVSQASTLQRGYKDQMNHSWYTSQVKSLAEGIADDDTPPTWGTVTATSKSTAYEGGSAEPTGMGMESPCKAEPIPGESLNPPGSFEVTSSLEDALMDAAMEEDDARYQLGKEGISQRVETPREASPVVTTASLTGNSIIPGSPSSKPISPLIQTETTPHKRSSKLEDVSPSKKARVLTAEEHNAILLADPNIRKSSTGNPEFLKQYYSESRLHHLSTWKADLKSRFQQMAAEKSASQKQLSKPKPGSRCYIMHVDFDSFFCAVSLKSAPEYVDKPAVVAHGSGNESEIASCNYPARAFGVKNGMWMKGALKLCPNLKVLPYDFPAYEEASEKFYEAILDVGGIVQSVSVDEALVDITSLCLAAGGSAGFGLSQGSIYREQEKADSIAQSLRDRIKNATGCSVSVGIGGNILLAKVALRKAKPAGQYHLKPEEALDFLAELSVKDLPGVAYSIGGKLEEIGVKFVKDVRQLTKDRLITVLGPKTGEKIWDYSRGIDRTEVGQQVVRKSVSAEINWGIRFTSQAEAEEFVQKLCIELKQRLVDQRVKGRQLTMKIKKRAGDAPLDPPKHLGHGKCDTYSKSIVLGVATNNAEKIGKEAISILRSYAFAAGDLRGLGVQMTKLDPIKPSSNALADGSQRRINFGAPAAPPLGKEIIEDLIDDPVTPKKPKTSSIRRDESKFEASDDSDPTTSQKPKWVTAQHLDNGDPIHDSPQKPRATPIHPAAAITRSNAADQSAKKFLNLTGTQFIIPSQIDPDVLAELPQDIRSKLMNQAKRSSMSRGQSPATKSRSQSPFPEAPNRQIPPDLDPEVFESLPEELKAEVLASYSSNTVAHGTRNLLPQSPRKIRGLNANPKKTTPTKKRGLLFRGRNNKQEAHSTLTQANFVTNKKDAVEQANDQATDSEDYVSETLDPEFLSALPEDMRQEIIDEHRRKRLAKKGGLVAPAATRKPRPSEPVLPGQRKLQLPPRERRPTFTTQQLTTLPQLRDALSAWHEGFADDGPHPDDVSALERYLKRVVLDELDMEKVVGVVKWLEWLIDESNESNESNGSGAWAKVLRDIKEHVQSAVQERGLGRLEL